MQVNSADIITSVADTLRSSGCVFAEEEARLLVSQSAATNNLDELVSRRIGGEPIEFILGWAEFCGQRIRVGPGAFVPRRRTEFLARKAIALMQPHSVVLDLGCGTGALGVAALGASGGIELYATDIDPAEISWARLNLEGSTAQIFEGSLFDPLPLALRGRINVLVANMPYVPTRAIGLLPSEARIYESKTALDGGEDGLRLHRQVAAAAPSWLAKGGHLLIETSQQQAAEAKSFFIKSGLRTRVTYSKQYNATVIIGSV